MAAPLHPKAIVFPLTVFPLRQAPVGTEFRFGPSGQVTVGIADQGVYAADRSQRPPVLKSVPPELVASFFLPGLRGPSCPTPMGIGLFAPGGRATSGIGHRPGPKFRLSLSPPSDPPLLTPGGIEEIQSIDEKLLFGGLLGRGRYGDVYVATLRGRPDHPRIAVKVIDPDNWGRGSQTRLKDLDLTDREIRNWQLVGGGRFFPRFYGAYMDRQGKLYILLEEIPGHTLMQNLQSRIRGGEGPYAAQEARRIILETARALSVIHNIGYLHRDVSSANVMITPDHLVRLLDIGAMKQAADNDDDFSSTSTFTPGYAAPEIGWGRYSEQSDLYALGVLWAEITSGMHPTRLATPNGHGLLTIRYSLPDPEDDRLFQRLIATNPEDRPRNVEEVIAALWGRAPKNEKDECALSPLATPRLVKEGWNVPKVAAVDYISEVIQSRIRDGEKVTALKRYLQDNPVDERDRVLVEQAIALFREGRSYEEIGSAVQRMDQENPERIFGYTRDEMRGLLSKALFLDFETQAHCAFLWGDEGVGEGPPVEDVRSFKQIIERFYAAGLPYTEAKAILTLARGPYEGEEIHYDRKAWRETLRRIKRGELGERVATILERYKVKDKRVQALIMTLEDGGLVYEGDRDTDQFMLYGDGFGKPLVKPDYYGGFPYRLPLALGAYFGLGIGIGGAISTLVMGGGWLTALTVFGACVTGFPAALCAIAALFNEPVRLVRWNRYSGTIEVHYSTRAVLASLNQTLAALPPASYHLLPEAMKKAAGEAEGEMTPYRLLEETPHHLAGLLEGGEGQKLLK